MKKLWYKELWKLAVSVLVCVAVGAGGSVFVGSTGQWYQHLEKPFFQPPDTIFGPVWTVLYIMMAVAAFLVWRKGLGNKLVRGGLAFFAVQLVLNGLWTPLFFGLKSPAIAMVDLVVLWLAIIATTMMFFKVSRAAGWLMIPYLTWVSFAGVLNASIIHLN